ncbi:16S rRNA methyltransferase [Porphyromonas canoris]|uniref:Ribosomal RNA small subunit methyltransferase A n=1 Tax=Porphyromonas canoris TaxID=36875 RepID=A0ABR4XIY4_9PORP|nr:16S rRNA (adenine(1518)-N(6)/adenine(1519)-N(6))-dimethyltransferase RsmA [Porphyromonas canoris]KGL50612.1 16S rRNA methyltransferase [Porphyromonas canoris]KGN91647.1 16S rRNA methyltransferase [Porphyromonas canoris]
MKSVRAKKYLGQHFLRDEDIAYRIAETMSGSPLPILEVGPGMGVLTKYLLRMGRQVKVAEIDTESVSYLKTHYPSLEGDIIEGDFLQMDLSLIFDGESFAVIGNYPYNISSQIFFKILEHKEYIPLCSGMLQKEVAERLASPPGSKDYGILSVFLQAWYDVEYLFTVGREVFLPPPKVQSGVIILRRNGRKELGCDEKMFRRVVKTAFNQRRKTMRNSLRPLLGTDYPDYADPVFNKRPEQLSVEDFITLTLRLTPHILSQQSAETQGSKTCSDL